MPRDRSYDAILQDSPILNTELANSLFPEQSDREELERLAKALDSAIEENQKAAQAWQSIGEFKDIVLKLLSKTLGKTWG